MSRLAGIPWDATSHIEQLAQKYSAIHNKRQAI